jgi:hypothetical protein
VVCEACTYSTQSIGAGVAAKQCLAAPADSPSKWGKKLVLIVALSVAGLFVLLFVYCMWRRHQRNKPVLDYQTLNM